MLPTALLLSTILLHWNFLWSRRWLPAAYTLLPIFYLWSLLNHQPFPASLPQTLVVAAGHLAVTLALCWEALPEGYERGWLLLLAVLVAHPFAWIVWDAGFPAPTQADTYFLLTSSTMAAAAIAGMTVSYIACFKTWDRLAAPGLVGVYFGVDAVVNALARRDPWNLPRSLTLAQVDHAVHLLVVWIALWLLHAERSARTAPSSPAPR